MSSHPVITLKRQFGPAVALAVCLGLLSTVVRADTPAPVFAGTSSYVLVGTPDALQIPSGHPFTVEGWMKFNAFDAAEMLYSKNAARTSPYSYMFGVRTSGTLLCAYTGAGGSPANTWLDVPLSPALTTGLWYHVAFSYDGTTLSYYLNGALKGTNAFSFANYTNHTVKIGGYATGTDVAGMKNDVRVWNQARTRAELLAFKDRRLTGLELGLLAYWPLNEGTGTNVFDRTINACTGALVGATWTNDAALTVQPAPGQCRNRQRSLYELQRG
jgi:hypothetical protein